MSGKPPSASLNDSFRLASAQWSVVRGDFDANIHLLEKLIKNHTPEKFDFLALPELFSCGFCGRKLVGEAGLFSERVVQLGQFAQKYNSWLTGSIPALSNQSKIQNRLIVIDNLGQLVFSYNKLHLFPNSREPEFFEPGNSLPEVISAGNWKIGFGICFDLRFPAIFTHQSDLGANIFIVPVQFPEPRQEAYRIISRARAIENQSFFVTVNRTGVDGVLNYFGGSLIVAPGGDVLHEAGGHPELSLVDLHLNTVLDNREKFPFFSSTSRVLKR